LSDKINIFAALEYVESITSKYGWNDSQKQFLFVQLQYLKNVYGPEIPKREVLKIVSEQWRSLQAGYKKTPVGIEEFCLSTEYLNLGGGRTPEDHVIRPKVLETLIDLFENNDDKFEVVLGGAIRSGKTFLVCVAFSYHLYRLSCLISPQVTYNLHSGSEIVFVFQSRNEQKAKRNFHEFHGIVSEAPYFKEHFPLQGRSKNYAKFPNNITVKPVPSSSTAGISENIFAAMIDEANFLPIVKGSVHQGEQEQFYDQATRLYQVVKERISLQFKDYGSGLVPGKLYLVSSANYKGDFIDKKMEEAKENDNIYVFNEPIWNVKPMKLSGRKFWVILPDDKHSGKMLDKRPETITDNMIEVPIEFWEDFENDLVSSIQNKAGVPVERTSSFLPVESLQENIKSYFDHYGAQQIFTAQETNINESLNVESLLNIEFMQTINEFAPQFHAHLDMSLSEDSAGLSVGAVLGSKDNIVRKEYDEEGGVKNQKVSAPITVMFGMIRINPPDKGEISIEKVVALLVNLKYYMPKLKSFTSDYAYSAYIRQEMRKIGITVNELSVDKNVQPYFVFKDAVYEGRVWMPEHEHFKDEVKHLKLHADTGKIDHDVMSSKDVADSVAATTFKLSKLKKSLKMQGQPYTLKEMKEILSDKAEKEEEEKPKQSRPTSSNRPKGWNRGRRRF
jgi:hypothetical protein